jgi:protocatechuate 3,4-dioxygenase beta subunit
VRERGDRVVGGRSATTGTSTGQIPEETAGPYPADGSNGPNVLDDAGVVRRDIRSGFGSSTTTAEGVPLTITLMVTVTVTDGAAPLAGAAVYLWPCDSTRATRPPSRSGCDAPDPALVR